MLSADQMNEALTMMIDSARRLPGREMPIVDQAGATVATLTVHEVPARPQDMPRALRPKQKLSKRARAQAKREKLATLADSQGAATV